MNEPNRIFIQQGEDYDPTVDEFRTNDELTWCEHRIFKGDIEYVLAKTDRLRAQLDRADHLLKMARPPHYDPKRWIADMEQLREEIEAEGLLK